jgi:hypothetical protein
MSFLAGFVAFFAALGAIPIIIHLLNRRQFKIVVWAAMEFLLKTLQKNSRRLQMRDLILLLLRVCAIVFLALALARPTIAPGGLNLIGAQGESAAAVILDNSMSMGYAGTGESRFERGKRRAADVINQLPKGSAASLIFMSDIALDDIPEPSHDLPFALEEVQNAPLSDGGTDVVESLAKAWKSLGGSPASNREIYLITDMQSCAWPEATDPAWMKLNADLRAANPPVRLYIADVGDVGGGNVSIDSFQAEDEVITTESEVSFIASLRNHAAEPQRNVTVELSIGDASGNDLRKVASAVIDTIEGEERVRLSCRFEQGGDHRVEVTSGLDRLGADNRRAIIVDVIDRIKVLLIDGDPSPNDDPFGGETAFLQAALHLLDPNDEEQRSLIDVETCPLAAIGEKTLDDYAAVIMANVAQCPPSLSEGLKTFVRAEGKGLIVFLGANVQPDDYNRLLFEQAGLLPGRIGQQFVEAPEQGVNIGTTELSHPIVSFFGDKDNRHFVTKPRFRKYFPIEMPKEEAAPAKGGAIDRAGVVARFADGQPAIAERRVGRGSVLLFASTADKEWTDFPLTPAFLMITRRATQQAALGRRPEKTLSVHDPIVVMLGAKDAGAVADIRGPRGDTAHVSAIPSASNDLAAIEFGDTHFAGFYQLRRAQEESAQWFAANPPRSESNLEALDEPTLRGRYPDLEMQWIAPSDELAALVSEKRSGREIWTILFAIVVGCLLAESFLALRWAPKGA